MIRLTRVECLLPGDKVVHRDRVRQVERVTVSGGLVRVHWVDLGGWFTYVEGRMVSVEVPDQTDHPDQPSGPTGPRQTIWTN